MLRIDCNYATDWRKINGMKANQDKLEFMILSSSPSDPAELALDESTTITSKLMSKCLVSALTNTWHLMITSAQVVLKLPNN